MATYIDRPRYMERPHSRVLPSLAIAAVTLALIVLTLAVYLSAPR